MLSHGHYTATIKINEKWIKFDDNKCYEVDETNLISQGAYILVYKLQGEINTDYLKMMNLMLNNLDFKIQSYIKKGEIVLYTDSVITKGEPVRTSYGRGYLKEEIIRDGVKLYNVKFKFGSGVIK